MNSSVVVGYDGSAAGERALVEAAHEASRREAPLTILHAVRQEASLSSVSASVCVGSRRRAAEELLAGAADLVRYRYPDVTVRTSAVSGPAPVALGHASRDAGLVVVGRRSTPSVGLPVPRDATSLKGWGAAAQRRRSRFRRVGRGAFRVGRHGLAGDDVPRLPQPVGTIATGHAACWRSGRVTIPICSPCPCA